jgi:hypothetical protein
MGLLLGSVLLDGFEVSGGISFGGKQALAVHKLPGGTRVVDAMGQDDHEISWQGILSGSDATDRARALDAMRVGGIAVPLAWDVFSATVIVSDLTLEFRNSWWVPYRLACTVVIGTQMPSLLAAVTNILSDVLDDLGLVAFAPGVATALALVSLPGATIAGGQAFANAVRALNAAGTGISRAIVVAEAGMGATDLVSLAGSAGDLANLTSAAGYVGRATTNFVDGAS